MPQLAGLLSAGTVLVSPMERSQLRAAILAPAERAPGLSFERGLVDRILDDAAAEPGQLPLVESLLTELWNRRDGGYMTVDAYEQAGGVAGVVATHAESVIAGFTEPDDESTLRRLFTALPAPDREGRFVRTPLPWADLATDLRPLVARLAAGRLIVIEHSATGAAHVQLAHQALIAHWPRLRNWLTEDRDFLAWRAQLDQQRERWEANAAARTAMFRMSMAMRSVDHVFPSVVEQPVLSFSASDDGNTLLVREGHGAVVLIGARGDTLQRWTLPEVPPGLDRFFVGPDGNYVAATGGSRAVSPPSTAT